jgi:uncharacterized protein YecE (DUF72 family)
MQVWIGTAGYSYPNWQGKFYPDNLKADRKLAYYSRFFPAVEFNSSFYRPPTADQLLRLAGQTPPGFQFVIKLPRSVTHEQRPDDLVAFREGVEALRAAGRLLGTLCQFPESTRNERMNRLWVERIGRGVAGLDLAVEFRHRSWAKPDVPTWLAGQGIDLASVDVPDLPQLFPRGLMRTGRRVYVRLHSRVAENWYAGDGMRYNFDYNDAALIGWAEAIREASSTVDRALLFFNNCHGIQGVMNAQRMRVLLAKLAPDVEVVAPFAEPPPRQLSLFDS